MVFEKIAEYASDKFDKDIEDLTLETTFEELRAEEEDIIDMAFELSREFDIIIEEDDVYGITDLGGLVELINSLME